MIHDRKEGRGSEKARCDVIHTTRFSKNQDSAGWCFPLANNGSPQENMKQSSCVGLLLSHVYDAFQAENTTLLISELPL